MRSNWLFIPALLVFFSCNKKEVQVKNGIDSVRYFAEQHAKAERSLKEANAIIDMILVETKSVDKPSAKDAPIADRLFQLHAAVQHDQKQKARMAGMIASLKNQASAYEMMAVALKEELEFRDQPIITIDTVRQSILSEPSAPATAKAEVIYINFPEQ